MPFLGRAALGGGWGLCLGVERSLQRFAGKGGEIAGRPQVMLEETFSKRCGGPGAAVACWLPSSRIPLRGILTSALDELSRQQFGQP
jgi:hypothetical protein